MKEFNYLGLLLTKTGNFKRAIKTLADKGTKAMYEILKRGKFHNLFISCRLDLFNKVVNPILLYGCELWGLSNCDIIKVITKLPNSEQSYKGKVQTHNYINRQNQSTTGKL